MEVQFAYHGRSRMLADRGAMTLGLCPNLKRDPVAFDAALRDPVRFREAISALHDVVINDLRFKPRDKSAYQAWKQNEAQRRSAIRREAYQKAKEEVLAKQQKVVPADLERQYNANRARYWKARQQYSNFLLKNDYELWRQLMPCDPVVTVADDVVFFECFSTDESSYGCLTVERDALFGPSQNLQLGTTNVDYSWDLYHHFQALRSYRETRFRVDPEGFEVATSGAADYREEKIDLPDGWLRGLMQIQVAMALPMRRVTLSREAIYSLLAWMKRHRARKSPRAMRFELVPGEAPRVVLEPWEEAIVSRGTKYDGPPGEFIRVWGSRRLLTLARALPLIERVDVNLLGTGLPSFWVAQMGSMRLTLGLSGWTTNDWTRGSALDMLAPPIYPSEGIIARTAAAVRERRRATLDEIRSACALDLPTAAAAMNHLAHTGQLIYDLDAKAYRWRQIMPQILGEFELGPENAELVASREIAKNRRRGVKVLTQQETNTGLRLFTADVAGAPVEMLLDGDGMIKRGKCNCCHHFKTGLRNGPCRHLLALRSVVREGDYEVGDSVRSWYERLLQWTN